MMLTEGDICQQRLLPASVYACSSNYYKKTN